MLEDSADLVALQMADEVPTRLPTHGGKALGSPGEGVGPILTEVLAARIKDPARDLLVHRLGHGDKVRGGPAGTAGRLR